MYKLVAIDLDGTLVIDDKKLTNRTIETIKKASEKGVKIMISSARAFYRLEKYIEALDLKKEGQYTICFNGGMIVENATGNIVFSKNLEEDEVKEIIELGKKLEVPMMLYAKQMNFVEKVPEILANNKIYKGVNFKIEKFENNDYNKEENHIYRIAFIDKSERIMDIRNKIPKEIEEKYEITSSVPEYIEFVKKGIKKSEAIQSIMKTYQIKQEEVMAMGDGENDIEMLKFAGWGVAMKNAREDVKKVANVVTTSNNEDGVAKAIEKYILEGDK